MKVSLNWVKEFAGVELPINELVDKIGAQLGAVDEVVNLGERYQGIFIVKVVECGKLEGSDHLNVCKIDDGGKAQNVERDENGLMQVVCGAPNVREGMFVAWLPPGATVPASWSGDKFVLEAREIRGVKSNGMLASAKELAIGDSHEGLLELSPHDGRPGDDFAETYGLNDYIIDIENKMFTHRPDCFGMLGVAREIAGIQRQAFKSPAWYLEPQAPAGSQSEAVHSVGVTNEIPELCPRYMLLAMDGITIAPSPVWLQTYLSRVGVRPINNVVDMTNYIMLLTGQPLHAFDFDKVAQNGEARIVVRNPHNGEKMTLLDGKEITPRPDAILICDPEKPIALGGIMGGNNSEIDENTKRILIECANFDMYNIRRTSMEHGIFSDAATRFTKGQSSWQCPAVLYQAVALMEQLCPGAKPVGEAVDFHQPSRQNQPVQVSSAFINERLGEKLSTGDMKQLLENVEFKAEVDGDTLAVTAPFWRTDVELREDVVEEIGRLHGYDKLPLELPRRDLTPALRNPLLELKDHLRASLSAAGANEVLTYSFVHGNLLDKAGQDKSHAFQLSNALSPDLQYYRLSLVPSLLEKVHANIKAGYDEFALFELGKAHIAGQNGDDDLPREDNLTSLVVAAADKLKKPGAAYYQARKYLVQLLGDQLTFSPVPEDMRTFDILKPFDMNRSAFIYSGKTFLGLIGEFRPEVRRNLKLPAYCAGFELDTEALQSVINSANTYVPLPRYPKLHQDISLRVPTSVAYQKLFKCVWDALSAVLPENSLPALSPVDIYQGDDAEHKNITLRFALASYERTLTDKEVAAMLDAAAAAAKDAYGAERL